MRLESSVMPMKNTTIRLPESLWELVEREAGRDGISGSQWIRDAVLLRLGYQAGATADAEEVVEMFRRVLGESPPRKD